MGTAEKLEQLKSLLLHYQPGENMEGTAAAIMLLFKDVEVKTEIRLQRLPQPRAMSIEQHQYMLTKILKESKRDILTREELILELQNHYFTSRSTIVRKGGLLHILYKNELIRKENRSSYKLIINNIVTK